MPCLTNLQGRAERSSDVLHDICRDTGKEVCDMKETVMYSCLDGYARDVGAASVVGREKGKYRIRVSKV